jgi:hypothetical protein
MFTRHRLLLRRSPCWLHNPLPILTLRWLADRGGLAYSPPPLLWALSWVARHVPPSSVAARALGQIFDSTVLSRHAVRPMADAWVGWLGSVKWTRRFGEEWTRQLPKAAFKFSGCRCPGLRTASAGVAACSLALAAQEPLPVCSL